MQVAIKTCSSVVKPKAMGIQFVQSISIYSHYFKSNSNFQARYLSHICSAYRIAGKMCEVEFVYNCSLEEM